MLLCDRCIKAVRSRGEKVFVWELAETDDDNGLKECQWYDEPSDELRECVLQDETDSSTAPS